MMQTAPVRERKRACLSSQTQLVESVLRSFHESGYAALRHVDCTCRKETIVLTGRVPSFYMKQLAQTIARSVQGVVQVDNQVHVETE